MKPRDEQPDGDDASKLAGDLELPNAVVALASYVQRFRNHPSAMSASTRANQRRADRAALVNLYDEVLTIFTRLIEDLMPIHQAAVSLRSGLPAPRETDLNRYFEAMPKLTVDLKSLHHWCYSIVNFVRKTEPRVDVSELDRISLFRSKLIVHYPETPMGHSGRLSGSGTRVGPNFGQVEIIGHPWQHPKRFISGHSREFHRLEQFVPGLRDEGNYWERVRLVYKHFNGIADPDLRKWVRDTLFGTAGIPSEQPLVIVAALHQVLMDYVRVRRYRVLPPGQPGSDLDRIAT